MPKPTICKKCAANRRRKAYASTGSFFVRNVRLADGTMAGYWVHSYYDKSRRSHSHSTGEKGTPAVRINVSHVKLGMEELNALIESKKAAPKKSPLYSALAKLISAIA
jgi:hypothetical protein